MEAIFKSKLIGIDTNQEHTEVVGFSEDETYSKTVIIQSQQQLSEAEKKMGWTKYYVEIFGNGAYSCLTKVSLNRVSLTLHFNSIGVEKFGIDSIFIHFDIADAVYLSLEKALRSAFASDLGHQFKIDA